MGNVRNNKSIKILKSHHNIVKLYKDNTYQTFNKREFVNIVFSESINDENLWYSRIKRNTEIFVLESE